MKKFIYLSLIIFLSTTIASAFSNSLDQTQNGVRNNNFTNPMSTNTTNPSNSNNPYNPKEHTGFEHQDRQFPNPSMNDTRYNSNCQFGTCSPGGLNPNNK